MRASILLLLNGVDALTLVRARCLTTRARTAMLASDGEVLMLGAYPFYTRQPTALMDEVFAVNEARVRSCLSDTAVVQRIGSSAIRGMPGIPVVDMLAAQPEWPPSQAQLAALAAAGFEAKGMAPHAADDMWFFGGDGPPGVGHCVLHVVQTINPFVAESRAFVMATPCGITPKDTTGHLIAPGYSYLAFLQGSLRAK